jgi:3-hydroxybutyryl-CoA dehydrogenase
MGLMGTSIAACLLIAGHPVAAVDSNPARCRQARARLREHLQDARREGLLQATPAQVLERFTVSGDFAVLASCQLVIESVFEDLQAKRRVIRQVEDVVSPRALIGSNTSSLPITQLQKGARHPERVLGIHWGEPAHILRFMEIICGQGTAPAFARRALALARRWGKEPSLVRRDIRGFITNRIMYAMLREAFHLVESGYATVEDVDRSCRNDYGFWITLAGPFRYMDLTGIPAYAAVMKGLLPELSCHKKVPALMKKTVRSGALGVANARGFYRYTPAQARRWEKLFLKFSYDIRALAQKYPEGAGD